MTECGQHTVNPSTYTVYRDASFLIPLLRVDDLGVYS